MAEQQVDLHARNALVEPMSGTAKAAPDLSLALPQVPRRIEVYDNSHIQGTNAVGAMIVAGADGFIKNQYR